MFPFSLFLSFSQGESKQPPEPDDQRELVHLFLADTNAARFHHHGRADRHTHLPDNHRDLYPPVCFLLLQSALADTPSGLSGQPASPTTTLSSASSIQRSAYSACYAPLQPVAPPFSPTQQSPPHSPPQPLNPQSRACCLRSTPITPYGTTHAVKL